jgi:DNA-binding transcriptional regulator/RsmH inhibitor MraZ
VNRLSAMLKKLAYIYPYHQVVGFYLERAEYNPSQIDLLRKEPMNFDFYLTHKMSETDFDKNWRLFIPKGF